jgi:group II intron reverse transcriptase/maturase
MGDTLRSQTISTASQGSAEQRACDCEAENRSATAEASIPVLIGESSLVRIRTLAEAESDLVFTSLAHRIDVSLLRKSFNRLKKSESSGVDEITAKGYAENLMENLHDLYQRLRSGRYRAMPVKRAWIDKEDGKKRPIGITALEDKIVQKAVATLLETVFDVKFHAFSHGFRKEHSQHKAIAELREQCRQFNIGWIVSADISGLFDNIEHGLLQSIIRERVNDGGILRLIGKWLHAGVMEDGATTYPDKGTPQGGVVSPILSNIFLHHVLDDWYVTQVKPRLHGHSFLIRWADDFIMGFELEGDARRVMEVLPKRFERFKLSLHPEKTKLIPFGRPRTDEEGRSRGSFDFLGFTFHWGRTLKGYWVIKKKTARKRLSRFMKQIWQWCKVNRHEPIEEQHVTLISKLRGFYQYFGVRSNYKALEVVFEYAMRAWQAWLKRRSSNGGMSLKELRCKHPLPLPRIVHNI